MIPRPRRLAAIGRAEWGERAVQAALSLVPLGSRPVSATWPHPVEPDGRDRARTFDGWTDPVTGRRRRGPWRLASWDPKPLWTLHTLRHLVGAPLPDAAQAAAAWIADNPPGAGPGWEDGATVAGRVASLLWLSSRAPIPGLEASLGAHRVWLRRYPSTGTSLGNHVVAEAAASALLGDGGSRLAAALDALVLTDGGGAEASVRYLAIIVEWALVAHAAGVLADLAPVARAARFLSALAPGLTGIGDDDGGTVFDDASPYVLSVAGAAAIATDQDPPQGWAPDRRSRMLGLADPVRRAAPADADFPVAGLAVRRSGPLALAFDFGPLGLPPLRAHGHADALAVWVSVDGRPVLGGIGTSTYRGPLRSLQRSAWGQSTGRIAGRDPSTQDGPFGWRDDVVPHDVRIGADTAAASLGAWRRTVVRHGDGFRIDDRCSGPLEIGFWLSRGLVADHDGTVRDGERVLLRLRADRPFLVERHQDVAASGTWGRSETATRISLRWPEGDGKVRIVAP